MSYTITYCSDRSGDCEAEVGCERRDVTIDGMGDTVQTRQRREVTC
jgi:hypothetical protein